MQNFPFKCCSKIFQHTVKIHKYRRVIFTIGRRTKFYFMCVYSCLLREKALATGILAPYPLLALTLNCHRAVDSKGGLGTLILNKGVNKT